MRNRVILAALVLLLLAGCVTQAPQVERVVTRVDASTRQVVTASPAPTVTPAGPTVTLADPNASAREMANNLYFVEQTVTAEARDAIATQVAFDLAQAEATSAALALTQQVEQGNAAATAYANSAQMTATAGALALGRQETAATATARVDALLDAQATKEAAEAQERDLEQRRRQREAEQADLDRQVRFILGLIIAVLTIALVSLAAWQGIRLLSVYVAIKARRMLVIEQAGLFIDAQTGTPQPLPTNDALALPAAHEQADEDRLKQAIKRTERYHDIMELHVARQLRRQWRQAAYSFLAWGIEYARDDKQIGYSFRRMNQYMNITRDEWDTMTTWLYELGVLEKENALPNASYRRKLNKAGEEMSVNDIMGQRNPWITSFEFPRDASLPSFTAPPAPGSPLANMQGLRTAQHAARAAARPHAPHAENEDQDGKNGSENTGWNLSLPPESLGDIDGEDVVEAG